MEFTINDIKQFDFVRELFEDQESKEVYNNLVLNKYTGKYKFIQEIVKNHSRRYFSPNSLCELIEQNKVNQKDKIILFGAGLMGKKIYHYLTEFGIEISNFCDNDNLKQGKMLYGIPIISVDKAMEDKNAKFVIGMLLDHLKETAVQQLKENGICDCNIIEGCQIYENQYFDEEIMKPGEDEVFIDGGCEDCRTSYLFREWNQGRKYKKILCFEPNTQNYQKCIDNINKWEMDHVEMHSCGLWDQKGKLAFSENGALSSVNEFGDFIIEVDTLDSILDGEGCTFIKLDTEGAELKALMGAKTTLQKYRPKLAITMYHKHEDMLEIPMYIKAVCPDYKLYLRHYSNFESESVLYAI